MTDRELMQQALEALDAYSWEQVQVATKALRDRLAQPEQKLVIDCPRCGHCCPKSNQEPVAWYHAEEYKTNFTTEPSHDLIGKYWQPLYTAPRPWVGLTEEEMDEIVKRFARYELVRTVEAKLKEKNK